MRFYQGLLGLFICVSPFAAAPAAAASVSISSAPAVSASTAAAVATSTATAKARPTQRYGAYDYPKPKFTDFITREPGDFVQAGKQLVSVDSLLPLAGVATATGVLLLFDQNIRNWAVRFGNNNGISQEQNQKILFSIHVPFLPAKNALGIGFPHDLGTAMYFLGDGWCQTGIALGFLTYGYAGNNYRAYNTASEIGESVITSGIVVQVLKHLAGRRDPFLETSSGDLWRPFPNQFEYAENVPYYDSFPTGHLAAYTAVFTVIAMNYSEYDAYIIPGAIVGGTALGYQMVNNGVHWASDYPLGIYLGYVFAKIAVKQGRAAAAPAPRQTSTDWHFYPTFIDDAPALAASRKFG